MGSIWEIANQKCARIQLIGSCTILDTVIYCDSSIHGVILSEAWSTFDLCYLAHFVM